MKKLIVGNWKMHGTPATARPLVEAIMLEAAKHELAEVVLCPPAPLLGMVHEWVSGSILHLGGQDCHIQEEGAYTGDVSASLLEKLGCQYVIVGHSERRMGHGETDAVVCQKATRALLSGLIPIICIGETQSEHDADRARTVITRQLEHSLPDRKIALDGQKSNFVLAYEPVWAIGSGKTPTLDDIHQMHQTIVSVASSCLDTDPEAIRVLYGGSVKADNAAGIMAMTSVSGVLVGGASLKAEQFGRIIASASEIVQSPARAER